MTKLMSLFNAEVTIAKSLSEHALRTSYIRHGEACYIDVI